MNEHKSQPETSMSLRGSDGEDVLVSLETANEVYREYDFSGRVYRIERPTSVEYRMDGTTHRVFTLDPESNKEVMHVVPAPGYFGCVVRVLYQPDNI